MLFPVAYALIYHICYIDMCIVEWYPDIYDTCNMSVCMLVHIKMCLFVYLCKPEQGFATVGVLGTTRCGPGGNLRSKWANHSCTAGVRFPLEALVCGYGKPVFQAEVSPILMPVWEHLMAKTKKGWHLGAQMHPVQGQCTEFAIHTVVHKLGNTGLTFFHTQI